MIKISFLISSLCNEGPVNVLHNIIKYIDYSKYEVSIITFIPEKKSTRIDDFRAYPVSIHQLSPLKKISLLHLFFLLKKTVKRINPDILHAHCPRSLYSMCFLPKQYKRVYTIHNYPGELQKILYGKLKGNIIIWLNHFFTRKTNSPIGCAENISTLYKKKQGWDILNIPNGSSLPVWEENIEQKQQLRKKLALEDGVNYFIAVGRFSNEKNPGRLIQVFKDMNRSDIGLVLLGDGPLWSELKKEENSRILLPGFVTNVYDYLIASDYYVSASDGEGLANALLECMTVGLPLLLSDIQSHQDVLSKMNTTVGFLFDQHNNADILEKIEKLILLDKKTVAVEIKNIFSQHFTAEKMSKSYQIVYSDLYQHKIK